ncbi:MAG: ATP-binding protein [Bacillota bacterium]|nr:ATP-binding protein [Bacillota bacterium]
MKMRLEELKTWNKDDYYLIDVRSKLESERNPVDNAIWMSEKEVIEKEFDKKTVLFCRNGTITQKICEKKGNETYYLEGGYFSIVMDRLAQKDDDFYKTVEHSIIKKYRAKIWSKFTKALKEYKLVNEGDCIGVCISGGKDSMLMAKLFQELHAHTDIPFDVKFIVMDPGYSVENRRVIEENCRKLHIPITVYETAIFENVEHIKKSPCYICARMRRGHLYAFAQDLGCNKIALGHHYDDVIETILMSMLYGGQVQTMMPKLHSTNFGQMEIIRPLYFVREEDIKSWVKYNDLYFIQCACKFTDDYTTNDEEHVSKRQEIKHLIRDLKQVNPYVEANIFKSVENISLTNVVGYKDEEGYHHFLDDYDKK